MLRRSVLALLVLLPWPAASLAAAPEKVRLEIKAEQGAPRGSFLSLDVFAHIESGWHIQSHRPDQPFLIPTELTLDVPDGVKTEEVFYPPADRKKFAFAGDDELAVYEGKLGLAAVLRVPADFGGSRLRVEAALRYQACNDTTCLPPTVARGSIDVPVVERTAANDIDGWEETSAAASSNRDGAHFGRWLDERGLLFTMVAVALLGLGLNLTPCVYPLISVTIAYFGGQSREQSRVALLASLYVLGIALSFSTVGVAAALSGGLFGAALQKPLVLFFIAGVLVALALSSFGIYQLQPPAALLRWAGASGTGVFGALFMGLTMGIVAAPCVGPIVLGLLVFVGSRQDPLLGLLLFFFLALGMGAPYLALAMAAGSIRHLPRSGEWLIWMERLFGCVLLGLAAYFVAPALPQPFRTWLLPVVVGAAGLYLGFIEPAGRTIRYFPVIKRAMGVAMMGAGFWFAQVTTAPNAVAWQQIDLLDDGRAANPRPMLIDFAAEWCIPCREMEHTTYANQEVLREAERFHMVKADITEENAETTRLVERFEVRGVPTVILLSAEGEEHERFVGYVSAGELLGAMRKVP
jgi:thiol:disulfide interchange protein DsbD